MADLIRHLEWMSLNCHPGLRSGISFFIMNWSSFVY